MTVDAGRGVCVEKWIKSVASPMDNMHSSQIMVTVSVIPDCDWLKPFVRWLEPAKYRPRCNKNKCSFSAQRKLQHMCTAPFNSLMFYYFTDKQTIMLNVNAPLLENYDLVFETKSRIRTIYESIKEPHHTWLVDAVVDEDILLEVARDPSHSTGLYRRL